MSSLKCPYCGGPLDGKVNHPPLNNRKHVIYHTVAETGEDGIESRRLMMKMYEPNPPQQAGMIIMRVTIHELNKLLVPYRQKIRNLRGRYFLISTQEE